ncbi:SPFH domain-containing protein [Enterobacteriaceae endosymbiont of Plateumaris rustica]|uniref:SPFH domain-containing protein n=1 Tax=Enterobacteriaceae endosymbiont of Plateumaris rustica TaxID=2675796 RepID=UPI001449457A|nr:SPFH domain-containing protein [Enterobacteriaceae endosymbiont of Plateumaris rustica]QJC29032.1 hypothetical protein GJT82_00895 [Enterobacteriaceae endosymbiont of Plateumaris rustica]
MNKNGFNKNKIIKYSFIFFLFVSLFLFINGFYIIKNTDKGVVTRLGKLHNVVLPGLHWKLFFFDKLNIVNVVFVKILIRNIFILTLDLYPIYVKMITEYKVVNPLLHLLYNKDFIYNFKDSIDSVLNQVIGKFPINYILTNNYNVINDEIKKKLQLIAKKYNFGIDISNISIEYVYLPKKIEKLFNNYFLVKENKKKCIRDVILYYKKIDYIK